MNGFLSILFPVTFCTIGNFSDRWTYRTAKLLAFLTRLFYRRGVHLVQANIRVAFPEISEKELSCLVKENFFHILWNGLDFIRLLKHPEWMERMLVPEDDSVRQLPPQAIACIPHLGNWEMIARLCVRWFNSCAAVATVFPYKKLNEILDRARKYSGIRLIPRVGAVRGMLRAVAEGITVGVLIDQNLSPHHGGVYVDLFGLPVPTSTMPALIAERYDIPLYTIACVRCPDGRFKSLFSKIVYPKGSDKVQITQAIIASNEQIIRQYPEQYLWLYKRWSSIPADIDPALIPRFPYYALKKKHKIHP